MVIWGGYGLRPDNGYGTLSTGAAFDPIAGTWTPTSTVSAPFSYGHTAVWTGSRMIVWGGKSGVFSFVWTGASYDPTTGTWTPTSTLNAPGGRSGHTAIWTGSRMIIWGGVDNDEILLNTGAVYDPTTDTWTPTSTVNAPSGRHGHTAVWTGSRMIVWGGDDFFHVNTGAVYDPTTDTWTPTSTVNAPIGRGFHTAVWTGSRMIVWGGYNRSYGYGYGTLNTGAVYNPATDAWTPTSTVNAPSQRAGHTATWTDSKMIVWGGASGLDSSFYGPLSTGALYDPTTNTWAEASTLNAPSSRYGHAAVSNGLTMVVWGGYDPNHLDTGGVYSPPPPTPHTTPADLAVTLTDGVSAVVPGLPLTYTIQVSNAGPYAATGAAVVDSFPSSLSGITWTCSTSAGSSCAAANGTGNIDQTVSLLAGGTATFVATATLNPATIGALVNTVTVSPPSSIVDPNPANNSATDADAILIPVDVSLTKTDFVTAVVPGQAITYEIVVSNAGAVPVNGVTVSDAVPASLLLPAWTCVAAGGASCSGSGSGDLSDAVNLPVGGTATYTLGGTLSSNPPSLSNTATVTLPSGYGDLTPSNNTAIDTDLILYPPTAFFAVAPCRVVDTRNAAGPTGGPALVASATRAFPVTSGTCAIPSSAHAVSVNLTVVGPSAPGFLTLYRSDIDTAPSVSSINFVSGKTRANNAIVMLAPDGQIKVTNGSAGSVHFVMDVNGYYQ